MMIGYMRVSKADGSQMLDLQKDALLAAGVDPVHIYEDQCSGTKDDRPGLMACLKALRKGDQLVIWRLDRLGRNMKHLVATVEDLNAKEEAQRDHLRAGAVETKRHSPVAALRADRLSLYLPFAG
jgi:DNA invertase Pin-like site-specific DNA recombinase